MDDLFEEYSKTFLNAYLKFVLIGSWKQKVGFYSNDCNLTHGGGDKIRAWGGNYTDLE